MSVLQSARAVGSISFDCSNTVTGFRSSKHTDTMQGDASPAVGASDANQNYPLQGTLAPSASVSINFNGITEAAFNRGLNPSRMYCLMVKGDGASWSYSVDAVAGFGGWLSGTNVAITMGDGEFFLFGGKAAVTIDGSHKMVTITNLSGAATLTYTLDAVLGA